MSIVLLGLQDAAERERWLQALDAALPGERWQQPEAAAPAEVSVALVAQPSPGSLAHYPHLQLIQSLWAGVDRLLDDPQLPAGVPVARMVDPLMSAAMAETALWATLALHRGFFAYGRRQRERVWRVHPQRRADEVNVTILGRGQMGQRTAVCLAQQSYRVAMWGLGAAAPDLQPAPRQAERANGVTTHLGAGALHTLLEASEIVINLLPLTPATRGLIDAAFLGALPARASLVNLARGAHVVDAHLLAALDSGHLRHAVLDVFAQEPLPADHPYWQHPRVTLLPHAAALTDPRSAAQVVARNLRALREGRPLQHLVDRARGY